MIRMATPADQLDLGCQWIENSTGQKNKITGVDDMLDSAGGRTIIYVESDKGVRKSMTLLTLVQNYTADTEANGWFVRCD